MTDEQKAKTEERKAKERAEFTAGLRELADWLEEHEGVPLPYIGPASHYLYGSEDEQREKLAEIARAGDSWDKDTSQYYFSLTRQFSGDISYVVKTDREAVCTRRVVGTRVVQKEITKVVGTEEVTEDMVEWECPDSLLRPREEIVEPTPEAVERIIDQNTTS